MEQNRSQYEIVSSVFYPPTLKSIEPLPLVIRDIGKECKSVTNDAENVVRDLVTTGFLPAGRRLFYYDSQSQLDEILIEHDKFAGFAPGPRT